MSLREETSQLSRLYGVRPTRNRGQNFLVDEKVYDDIITAAKLSKKEIVLEVGPGLGFLTSRLSEKAKEVIAVELDKKLASALESRLELKEIQNVTLFQADVMNFSDAWAKYTSTVSQDHLVVVANQPYTITSIFLRHFVGGNSLGIIPTRFVLMLQKEVAERLTAEAGAVSILAVSVQLYTQTRIIRLGSKNAFWPAPEVESALISLERSDRYLTKLEAMSKSDEDLMRLVRIGFSARRKMLKANLAAGFRETSVIMAERLRTAQIPETARAQELSMDDWLRLLSLFS